MMKEQKDDAGAGGRLQSKATMTEQGDYGSVGDDDREGGR